MTTDGLYPWHASAPLADVERVLAADRRSGGAIVWLKVDVPAETVAEFRELRETTRRAVLACFALRMRGSESP